MGEVVPARTSPTLHPLSPPTVHYVITLSAPIVKQAPTDPKNFLTYDQNHICANYFINCQIKEQKLKMLKMWNVKLWNTYNYKI